MTKEITKIQSGFALLDVKSGRKTLAKTVKTHRIPVTIKGYIESQWGNDDGTSIEFEVLVSSVTTGKPKTKKNDLLPTDEDSEGHSYRVRKIIAKAKGAA